MKQPLVTLRNTRPGFLVEGLPLSPEHPCHPGMKPGILFKAVRSIMPGKAGKSVKKKAGVAHTKVVHVKAGGMTKK